MREFDRITFSWGGELLQHEVTQAEVDAASLVILVPEATILAAGASDDLVLVYRVRDEVHNQSSDWSVRAFVTVEVGEGLFDPPMIENPDPTAQPDEPIDLDDLGDDDLLVNVIVYSNGLLVGDEVALTWAGTTAQGLPVTFTPAPQTVSRDPQVMTFIIPNGDVRGLGGGRAVASYTVTRSGAAAGQSKRAFVTFVGAEQQLPKPTVDEAEDGALDPALALATVVVPGEVLEGGDIVYLTWLGTRANGSTLLHEDSRNISGVGAGQPLRLSIPDTAIAPLDGGTLAVYYRVFKRSIGSELESEREHLTVGEAQATLPAPSTNPPPLGGVLDPDNLTGQLEIIVPAWPGMNDKQTVHLVWRASGGASHDDFMPVSAPMVGKPVEFYLDRAQVEGYRDQDIQLSYWVETPGEASQVSGVLAFNVGADEGIGFGPMRIMGARFNVSTYTGWNVPRMLSALDDTSRTPMLAEWRYEFDPQWSKATSWVDEKPWLKLYVRNASETWECNPANIVGHGGSGHENGFPAFVALGDDGIEVDMVAWGNPAYGGELDAHLANLTNVMEISATSRAFAARLRDGSVVCWGNTEDGGFPRTIEGSFVQVRGNGGAFAGRQSNGKLFAWGRESSGTELPERVTRHSDYVDLCPSVNSFAALRASGHVVAWGSSYGGGQLNPGQEEMNDIIQLGANINSFVALRDHGDTRTVIGWGISDIPTEIARLTNVSMLGANTFYAFSLLLDNGEVRVWGTGDAATLPEEIVGLTNVVEVSATADAFCARLRNGRLIAWGREENGGKLPQSVEDKANVIQVASNIRAFAALCTDGSVVAWGDPLAGGDTSAVATQLVDVQAIYGNGHAFAALTGKGEVVTWGLAPGGGDSSKVQAQLRGRVTHSRLVPFQEAQQLFVDD